MNSLTENIVNEKTIIASISEFCKTYSVGKALKKSNAYKTKGIPVVNVFEYLLQLVYTKKSMYMNIQNGTHYADFSKDVVYRFLNSTFINWSTFVLPVAMSIINNKLSGLTSDDRINAIIIDDTMYNRGSSKKVELLAKVHDHAGKGQSFKKGFRQLTLVWTDGSTLIPFLFRHLSSENEKSRFNGINPKIDKRTCGYKARIQAISKGPAVMAEMLAKAVKASIPAKHVLFDCWFSYPKTIIEITKIKLHVVARLKKTTKIKYLVNGEKRTLVQIFSSLKKRRGTSKYLLSVPVKVYNKEDEIIDARKVYVRDRNKRTEWIAIISTDMNLSEEEVIQLYGRRWDIMPISA